MVTVKHTITGYEVLQDGRIKPSAVLKLMQDAATVDASNLGADYGTMRKDDMIFVISKAMVSFKRVPMLDEEVEIRTWNGKIQGVSFNRDFVMYVDGEAIARATTRWVLVSYSERRILRPDALKSSVLTNVDEEIGIAPERRIKFPECDEYSKTKYRPTLTDMDTNGHVNNSRYADYLVDYCGINLLQKEICEFEIHFVSELKFGEEVEFVAATENSKVFVIGQKADGKQAFASFIKFCDK
ncbi:MAG: hypothetical protein E7597_04020 [Ruminococcaceae bacterium]|nr:hypothetical protein [Oscillospiraceae bacterium]